jgi:Fur family ferric uptake transcriptional regulator
MIMSMTEPILDSFRADGRKLTKPRKAILAILERSSRPVTVFEIADRLKRPNASVDLVTICWNLAMLREFRLANMGHRSRYSGWCPRCR